MILLDFQKHLTNASHWFYWHFSTSLSNGVRSPCWLGTPSCSITVCHTLVLAGKIVVVTKATTICKLFTGLGKTVVVPFSDKVVTWSYVCLQTTNFCGRRNKIKRRVFQATCVACLHRPTNFTCNGQTNGQIDRQIDRHTDKGTMKNRSQNDSPLMKVTKKRQQNTRRFVSFNIQLKVD